MCKLLYFKYLQHSNTQNSQGFADLFDLESTCIISPKEFSKYKLIAAKMVRP